MNGYSILLGKDEKNPLIEIRATDKNETNTYTRLPHLKYLKNFASIAAQAAPSLLTQVQVAKSSIMEVVVNGSLAKAADGDGFRAMVKGADGKIIENARLYNADTLSNLVNAAAVWQIASVVVAQKHLADINKKLDDLKDGIDRIQDFQQTDRKSNVFMISNKLKEKITILMNSKDQKKDGIVSLIELNSYDDILQKIYLHLKADLSTYGFKKTEHKEMFGTADYKDALEKKIEEVQEYLDFAYLSLSLRSMNTSVIDYLGGNDDLVKYRTNEIKKEIESLNYFIKDIGENITKEVKGLKSIINDAQSFVKNNKGNIAVGAATLALGPLGGVALGASAIGGVIGKSVIAGSATALGKKLFGEGEKSNLLEERKQEMLEKLNNCLVSSKHQAEYGMKLVNTNLHQLVEKEEPIKLAFQKLDDSHILCLNTNEKIEI